MGPKPTPQFVKNTAYPDRYADLEGGVDNAPIIGFSLHKGLNQRFTFQSQGGKDYKISVRTSSGHTTYVTSGDPSAGDELSTGPSASIYQVQSSNGYWYISIKGGDGKQLFWTLPNEDNLTRVTLEYANNSATQAWSLIDA